MRFQSIIKFVAVAAICMSASADTMQESHHWLPDPSRTPGAINPAITQANIHSTICKAGWSTKSIRPPTFYTNALKRKDLRQWGYADKNMRHYELDHLISLEIGGAPADTKNLWPEPYAGQWGARTKDKLENRLHKLVCNGTLTLKQAQVAISHNWIEAYKRYVLHQPQVAEVRR